MIPLPETVGLYFLPLLKCLSIHGVLQLSIFMSNLGYGCCGDAAVQYSWKTKVYWCLLGIAFSFCAALSFSSSLKPGARKEGELVCRAKVEQTCCTLGPVKGVWDGSR